MFPPFHHPRDFLPTESNSENEGFRFLCGICPDPAGGVVLRESRGKPLEDTSSSPIGNDSVEMYDASDEQPLVESAEEIRAKLAETVKRSLLQIGSMREIEAEISSLTEKLKKLTPPPEPPKD
jgi:hypothetical protein